MKHDPRVIIEGHCAGREVECSVLGNEAQTSNRARSSSMPTGDYEAKY